MITEWSNRVLELLLELISSGATSAEQAQILAQLIILNNQTSDTRTSLQLIDNIVDANNNAKTQLYILKDGTPTPVYLDTTPSTAPGHVPIPVVITDVNGSAVVNITAGDINVKIVHDGTDSSSIRIGDGTTLVGVTTSNELKVASKQLGSSAGGHISNGSLAITATQISGTSNPCSKAFVSAPATNTDAIYIGWSTLTSGNGVPLYPGDTIEWPVTNTNLIYALAVVLNEDVSVTYFN